MIWIHVPNTIVFMMLHSFAISKSWCTSYQYHVYNTSVKILAFAVKKLFEEKWKWLNHVLIKQRKQYFLLQTKQSSNKCNQS